MKKQVDIIMKELKEVLRQVLFDVRVGNSDLAKSLALVKKVTMQCTRMKTHTEACYPCKITKTNHFPPTLVTSIHEIDYFLFLGFQWDSHIFQMLSSVSTKVLSNIFIFHTLRSLSS